MSSPDEPNADDVSRGNAQPIEHRDNREHEKTPSSIELLLTRVLSRIDQRQNTQLPMDGTTITLPKFVPGRDDPSRWTLEIDGLAKELGWSDAFLMTQVASCFSDETGEWFANWNPKDKRSWAILKRDICISFAGTVDFGKLVHDAVNFNSDGCSSYGSYGRIKLQKIASTRLVLTDDQIVSLLCHGIKNLSLQSQIVQAGHEKVDSLMSHLSRILIKPGVSGVSRRNNDKQNDKSGLATTSSVDNSSLSRMRCFSCGKSGHKAQDCAQRRAMRENNGTNSRTSVANHSRLTRYCEYCKRAGHSSENCYKRIEDERVKGEPNNKKPRVNVCRSPECVTPDLSFYSLSINGFTVRVLLDTGAQVSLIRETLAKTISSEIVPELTSISGAGNYSFTSNHMINVLVQLHGHNVPLKLHVVDDESICCDVIIGINFLGVPGLTLTYNNKAPELSFIPKPVDPNLELRQILEEFKDMTATNGKLPTQAITNVEFKVRLNSEKEIHYRPYRMSMSEKDELRKIIQDLLENRIIRDSDSPYASPCLLVRKKNGSSRLVVDFRALNRITVKDRYPLPRIDDQIDRLNNSKYFSVLDMAAGFHQIAVHPDSIAKLAFVTPEGHYEYLRMPFGVCNAPSVFQKAINIALKNEIQRGVVVVYMDDVLITSTSIEQGLMNLKSVLNTLRSHGFSINLDKCSFLKTQVEYLGRVISNDTVKPSPSKTEALQSLPPPTNVKQMRQFLGLAGYFRKFIPEFSSKTRSLSDLTKGDSQWVWSNNHTEAFNYIKDVLSNEPVLAIFDPTLPIELHTDASSRGFGAILFQIHDGVRRVVAYFSKATTDIESRYHSYELETLAVVNALKHFRHYLVGVPFKLITDCNALKSSQHKRDLVPRVSRWWMFLQNFNFTIEHKPGKQMLYVDFFSRNFPVSKSVNNNVVRQTNDAANVSENDAANLMPEGWLSVQQSDDAEVKEIKDKLLNSECDKNQYCLIGSTLCHISMINSEKFTQYFVPKCARYALLKEYHDGQLHIGIEKTILSIVTHFWFPRLRQFVKKYIESCLTCLTKKRVQKLNTLDVHSIPKVPIPFHTLHIDCLGPLTRTERESTHVFVAVDAYSKYCFLYALKSQKTEELANCVTDIVYLVGTPSRIIADNFAALKAVPSSELLIEWNIEWHFITPYVHQANGQAERYMSFLANLLRVQSEVCETWDEQISRTQLIINSTVHKTTGRTPLQTLFGCDNRIPEIQRVIDTASADKLPLVPQHREKWRHVVSERLNDNAIRQEISSNKNKKKPTSFKIGEFVLIARDAVRPKKLESGWTGPYKVIGISSPNRYELRRVGDVAESTRVTTAAAAQMRPWNKEWTPEDCEEMLEDYLHSDDVVP